MLRDHADLNLAVGTWPNDCDSFAVVQASCNKLNETVLEVRHPKQDCQMAYF
jgi:hypothetical protein